MPPSRRPSGTKPAALRPFSTSYNKPIGELDRKGRPRTQSEDVIVETPEAALAELERQLRDRNTLSDALKQWLTDAIKLRRTEPRTFPTLDRALGLSKGRGSPGKPDDHEKLARRIFELRLQEKSWKDIASSIAATTKKDENAPDVRTLQRIYAKHKTKLLAEEISRQRHKAHERLARIREHRRRTDNK